MLDNSHLCTPPDAVIASTLRIGARWKNIFQSDKKYRHEVPSLRVGWLKLDGRGQAGVARGLSVPSLRVGWLKTKYFGIDRSALDATFSTLSSGRLAENRVVAMDRFNQIAYFQYP
ncbi:MAG TPA: hypothetical protein PKI52_16570, partial [Aggregatilineales bacterium]|nr:hypothetical protein [Aggregatilineales bacterium]